ncbi:signal recognition particle receptor subunit alpha, partial [Thiolapillus sp.]
MFGFGKKNKTSKEEDNSKPGLFQRLKSGLARTRANFTDGLANLVLGRKQIDDELLEDLETLLLTADVGVDATRRIIDELTDRVRRKDLSEPDTLVEALKTLLENILLENDTPVKQP